MKLSARQLLAAATFMIPAAVLGQNGVPHWQVLSDAQPQDAGAVSPASIRGNQLLVWHRDGAGKPPVIALVDTVRLGQETGGMLTWDGERWELYPLPAANATIGRSIVFDFDGDGPDPERVVAITTGVPESRVVFWNGSSWEALVGWTEAGSTPFGALASMDVDGDGPAPARLVGANQSVRVWENGAWTNIGDVGGTISSYGVTGLQYFDPDGSGSLPGFLYMGGQFSSVAGVSANRFARWNGAAWSAVPGVTMASVPGSMTVHDFDGDGPWFPELVVAGQITLPLGVQTAVAGYRGLLWRSLGTGVFDVNSASTPPHVRSFAGDGVGIDVLLYGAFEARGTAALPRVGRWDAAAGQFVPMSGAPGAGFDDNQVHSVVAADLDGEGPAPASLFATGSFRSSGGQAVDGLARWNGREWQPLSVALDEPVYSIHVADLDGDGPQPERTYLAGRFWYAGSVFYGNVAQFDGLHLSPVGSAPRIVANSRTDIRSFDPDGTGPEPAQLILSNGNLSRWDGADRWNILPGSGLSHGKCLHDPDGPGPEPVRMIIGSAGSQNLGLMQQYDGNVVSSFGYATDSGQAWTVASFDADGAGSAPAMVYVAGTFREIQGQAADGLAYYDGAGWVPLDRGFTGGTSNAIYDMIVFDPDGDGPRGEELIMGGAVNFVDGTGGVLAWDGAAFTNMGLLYVEEFEIFDADGDGPGEPRLVAVGEFATFQDTRFGSVAQWNTATQAWEPLYDGVIGAEDRRISALAVERPWGPRGPQRLAMGGSFTRVEGRDAVRLVRFSNVGRPWCLESPMDTPIIEGEPVVLRARVSGAYAGSSFRWRRDGADLGEGPGGAAPGGGVVTGSAGVLQAARGQQEIVIELRIDKATDADAGMYELVLENAAGTGVSAAVVVGTPPVCAADFNRDGALNTQDFFDFLAAFFAAAPEADVNASGSVDSQDLFDFLASFFTGC